MAYAYVNNGTVEYTRTELPTAWANISGFNNADLATHLSYGWYPLVSETPADLQLDQYYGPVEYEIQSEQVIKRRSVLTYTLDELKALLKQRGKSVAMSMFESEYPYAQGLAIALSVFGTNPRTTMIERLNFYVAAYQNFASEVDACTTKAQLLVVYNNYPQLHEEVL